MTFAELRDAIRSAIHALGPAAANKHVYEGIRILTHALEASEPRPLPNKERENDVAERPRGP